MTTTRRKVNGRYIDDGANQMAQARDVDTAAQIVREHNAHEAIREAIEAALQCRLDVMDEATIDKLEAALRLAKGDK